MSTVTATRATPARATIRAAAPPPDASRAGRALASGSSSDAALDVVVARHRRRARRSACSSPWRSLRRATSRRRLSPAIARGCRSSLFGIQFTMLVVAHPRRARRHRRVLDRHDPLHADRRAPPRLPVLAAKALVLVGGPRRRHGVSISPSLVDRGAVPVLRQRIERIGAALSSVLLRVRRTSWLVRAPRRSASASSSATAPAAIAAAGRRAVRRPDRREHLLAARRVVAMDRRPGPYLPMNARRR